MQNQVIIVVAVCLLTLLLVLRKKENRRGVLIVKTTLSALFVLTVCLQPRPIEQYFYYILAGLVLSLGGDVCLALSHKRAFLVGLISFLLAHVCYAVGFFSSAGANQWTWVSAAVAIVISVPVFLWLQPHLGAMKLPVIIYITAINVMVVGASSFLGESALVMTGRVTVFSGAILFYLSDLFVARHRFVKNEFINRLIGLPIYYAGQFLLAFSVGLVG